MADAIALCAAAHAFGASACDIYRLNFIQDSRDQASTQENEQGASKRSAFNKSAMKRLGKKASEKIRDLTSGKETKEITENKADPKSKTPKKVIKRVADKFKDFVSSKQKKRIINDNLNLERENEALKKRLHAEQEARAAEKRRFEEGISANISLKQENEDIKKRIHANQHNLLAEQRRLEEQTTFIIKLDYENENLEERIYIEQQTTVAEKCRFGAQIATLKAEQKGLREERDHVEALAKDSEQKLEAVQSVRDVLRRRLEEASTKALVAEKTTREQIVNTEQAVQRTADAEAHIKEVEMKAQDAEKTVAEHVVKIEQAEQRSIEAQAHIKDLQGKLVNAQEQTKEAQEKMIQLDAYAQKSAKEVEQFKIDIAKLRSALDDEEETNKYLEGQLTESQTLAGELQKALNTQQNDKTQTEEKEKLMSLNTQLQAELSRVKDSLDITENEALQATDDLETERAEKTSLAGQLKDALERAEQRATFRADFGDVDNIEDIEEARVKLIQAIQEIQNTQYALAKANEQLSNHSITRLQDEKNARDLRVELTEARDFIQALEEALSDRDASLNALFPMIKRVWKVLNPVPYPSIQYNEGLEEARKLGERCVIQNMQADIEGVDYLAYEVGEMWQVVSKLG